MEVILQKEVLSLGREGDVVKVAQGYAANYLIPKGLAVRATPGNLKQLEQKRSAIVKREGVARDQAQKLADKLDGKIVEIEVKAGAEGRLFGSVTTKDIAAAVEESLSVKIDRNRIMLSEPIKEVGESVLRIKVYPDVEASLEVKVIAEASQETEAEKKAKGETEDKIEVEPAEPPQEEAEEKTEEEAEEE